MAKTLLPNPKDLPQFGDENFLYVMRVSDGVVKVGRTGSAQNRFLQHRQVLRRTGLRITHFAWAPIRCDYPAFAERELRRRMRRLGWLRGNTKEWFYGVQWGTAQTLLRQIAPREVIELPWH